MNTMATSVLISWPDYSAKGESPAANGSNPNPESNYTDRPRQGPHPKPTFVPSGASVKLEDRVRSLAGFPLGDTPLKTRSRPARERVFSASSPGHHPVMDGRSTLEKGTVGWHPRPIGSNSSIAHDVFQGDLDGLKCYSPTF